MFKGEGSEACLLDEAGAALLEDPELGAGLGDVEPAHELRHRVQLLGAHVDPCGGGVELNWQESRFSGFLLACCAAAAAAPAIRNRKCLMKVVVAIL